MSWRQKRFGLMSMPDQTNLMLTQQPRGEPSKPSADVLASLRQPTCAQVTVFIRIGSWRRHWRLKRGIAALYNYDIYVLESTWRLTTSVRLTLRRYYVPLERTTESMVRWRWSRLRTSQALTDSKTWES